MNIEVHVYLHEGRLKEEKHLHELLHIILKKVDKIMVKQTELTAAVIAAASTLSTVAQNQEAAQAQLIKATAEIVAAVGNQTDASPELVQAVSGLQAVVDVISTGTQSIKDAAQALDDLHADEPTPG